ncbi:MULTISPECIES: nucleotidyltransferase family protein [Cyanophyceae]|uniref:nucleotidyltransferase family protein n=1 Tax=Leptolyngbya sp. FACHB-541 TaxID=2692810 RepID=UPI001F54CFEF|nr:MULTISPECIES: nucleotidyltransferase family protein [Cyanophyceae]
MAAGASIRMGTPKQLLLYQGKSLICRTVEAAIASSCNSIVVVLGAYAEQIKPEIAQYDIQFTDNNQWSAGMGTSIQAGIQALSQTHRELEAAIFLVCDQPFISTEIIDQLIATYHVNHKSIVASEYAGTLGVPALFNYNIFSELVSLQSTTGAKQIIYNHISDVIGIPFPQGLVDLDTPEDYQQLLNNPVILPGVKVAKTLLAKHCLTL